MEDINEYKKAITELRKIKDVNYISNLKNFCK
jgi:hypothetical protein